MRHRKQKKVLDRARDSRRALIVTLAINLLTYHRMTTTPVRARAVQQFLEPLIHQCKRNPEVIAIRRAMQALHHRAAARQLLRIATMAGNVSRNGGYLRRTRIAPRKGDAAPQVRLEIISYD